LLFSGSLWPPSGPLCFTLDLSSIH
jgi:hypothetical protein